MRAVFAFPGVFALASLANAATPIPVVTALEPIPLTSGINPIPKLAPDGRDGLIVLAWHDNGNAHGYDLALVLVQGGPDGPFNVVDVDAPNDPQWRDGVTDDPHMGVDEVRSFRFARGRVDGRPAVLLLVATRDPGDSIPSPSRVTFETYALEHDPEVGTTPDHFRLLVTARSDDDYCNADMALSQRFRIALRSNYGGPHTPDGCP